MTTDAGNADNVAQMLAKARDVIANPPPKGIGARNLVWAITHAWALDVVTRYGNSDMTVSDVPSCPRCGRPGMIYTANADYYRA